MLFCSTPTFPSKVSRFIQGSPNDDHSALIEEVVQLTLLSPYEVLESKFIDALKLFSASNKVDYDLDFTLSEGVADTGIVLMYVRSLLNQINLNPMFLKILVIIGKYITSNNNDRYNIDSKGFYEIVNQASIHGITDIFNCFNELASLSLDFQVLDFQDGEILKSKPVKTQLFESFELASNNEIAECIENPLYEGNLLTVSFSPILTPIIRIVVCNPESFALKESTHDQFFENLMEVPRFS